MSRVLASVQRIKGIHEIPKADFLEMAEVLGWECVVKKGEFKTGDKCCFFEIDSVLPKVHWASFMESRKYRVRTIRLRGQLSQGLALPLSTVGLSEKEGVGTDVTKDLGVTKYLSPSERKEESYGGKRGTKVPHAWMLRFSLTNKVHRILWPRKKGGWPEWVPKTDERRVQNITDLSRELEGRCLYYTEKLDGQSLTVFYKGDERVGLLRKGMYGVCSRNVWYKGGTGKGNWITVADKYKLKDKLEAHYKETRQSLAIQGEICGPGVQGNQYGLHELTLFVFNIWDIGAQKYLNVTEKKSVCSKLGLNLVPRVHLYSTPDEPSTKLFLSYANGISLVNGSLREGIVVRDIEDDSYSFKAISNEWLESKE